MRRTGKVPLSVPVGIPRSWIVRFGEPYLAQQVLFQPYPKALVDIADSGKYLGDIACPSWFRERGVTPLVPSRMRSGLVSSGLARGKKPCNVSVVSLEERA